MDLQIIQSSIELINLTTNHIENIKTVKKGNVDLKSFPTTLKPGEKQVFEARYSEIPGEPFQLNILFDEPQSERTIVMGWLKKCYSNPRVVIGFVSKKRVEGKPEETVLAELSKVKPGTNLIFCEEDESNGVPLLRKENQGGTISGKVIGMSRESGSLSRGKQWQVMLEG